MFVWHMGADVQLMESTVAQAKLTMVARMTDALTLAEHSDLSQGEIEDDRQEAKVPVGFFCARACVSARVRASFAIFD